ncbi:type III-B CRISPR-associated protein Cas10/Cmr2 [Emticicia agri]|uniref:CRISPR-associated protein Cmr2 N-terminal domain-containing protein n=1 Tax=Emticicia agri TaxID=2492393 RepID=A0A4Q5LTS3_9BACT|nr:type III-B CRISPR-associated protein Cas10/Cmr2 [Emticicia agri]RYU93038.1 hypothetical protein EWM59_24115 [Emticicia agri]
MKYHAITIGPIYQTFRNARQTREVWAASFLFSYLAKGIIVRTCLPDFNKESDNETSKEDKKNTAIFLKKIRLQSLRKKMILSYQILVTYNYLNLKLALVYFRIELFSKANYSVPKTSRILSMQ